MEDYQQNTGNPAPPNNPPDKKMRNLVMVIAGGGLIIIAILVYFALRGGESDYQKGVSYLKQSNYSAALTEFREVEPEDKDYVMAQSKINYINGLLAFNAGSKQEAGIYLSGVSAGDEYYGAAREMLERVKASMNLTDLEALREAVKKPKDTIIVKEEKPPDASETNKKPKDTIIIKEEKPRETSGTKSVDEEITKEYVSAVDRFVNKFDGIYQPARTAELKAKRTALLNMNVVYEDFTKLKYNAPEKNAMVLELKRLVGDWMQKRMNYIDKLLIEGSANETAASRSLLEDGDRVYNTMISQMKKVKTY